MSPAKTLWVAAAVIWLSAIAVVGPRFADYLAARFWPPVAGMSFVEFAQNDESVIFRIAGTKRTAAVLSTVTAAWVFPDATLMPAALSAEDGLGPPAPNRSPGPFTSRVYTVRVTPAARTAAGTLLRVCLVYEAVGLYCVETPYSAFPTP